MVTEPNSALDHTGAMVGPSADLILAALEKILASTRFVRANRMRRFLRFVVEKTLQGQAKTLREYTLALEVFDRDESFDPMTNALVRVEAGRLRQTLAQYYLDQGQDDPVVIEVPKGTYIPRFRTAASSRRHHHGGAELSGAAIAPTVPNEPRKLPDKPSIAVLAFDNMSNDPEQAYFSDGITEDIITNLSWFKRFHVIARNSTFTYKNRAVDVKTIARELGVRYVLEGSVRRIKQRVRITAQLIEAKSGHHVWAERYDRRLEDVFDIQDEISNTIAAAISPAFVNAELMRIHRSPPERLDAWDLALQAREAFGSANPANIAHSREMAEQAIAIDPENQAALTILAEIHIHEGWMGYSQNNNNSTQKGLEYAQLALRADSTDASAMATLGYALLSSRHFDEALKVLRQSVEQNSNLAKAYSKYGQGLALCGFYEETLAAIDRAIILSPREPMICIWLTSKAIAAFIEREYEQGIVFGTQAIEASSDYMGARRVLAATYAELGQIDEARHAANELLRISPDMTVARTRLAVPIRSEEALERYCRALEQAGLPSG